MYVIITDKDGNPIEDAVPIPVKLVSGNGSEIKVTGDGKLEVETSISVDSVTATDVTIRDSEDGDKKLVVNDDGSINAQVTGRKAQYRRVLTLGGIAAGATQNTDWVDLGSNEGYSAIALCVRALGAGTPTISLQWSGDNGSTIVGEEFFGQMSTSSLRHIVGTRNIGARYVRATIKNNGAVTVQYEAFINITR